MGGNWLCQTFVGTLCIYRRRRISGGSLSHYERGRAVYTRLACEDKNGFLVTAPSTTPENKFKDKHGKGTGRFGATTMDMSIIWDLFTNLIRSSLVLDTDEDFRNILIFKRSKLFPLQMAARVNCWSGIRILKKRIPSTGMPRICLVCILAGRSHRHYTGIF